MLKTKFYLSLIMVSSILLISGTVNGQTYLNQTEKSASQNKISQRDTDNWDTYKSATIGFSIQYPPVKNITNEIVEDGGKRVTFYFKEYPMEMTIKRGAEYVNQNCSGEKKIIHLSNISGTVISEIGKFQGVPYKNIYFSGESENIKTEIIFIINNYDEVKEKICIPVFEQMLSTFKITGRINFNEVEPAWEVNGWTIHKNEAFRFEFKSPPEYEKSTGIHTKVGPALISPKWGSKIVIDVYDNPGTLTLSDWVKSNIVFFANLDVHDLQKKWKDMKWKKVLVNGVESIRTPNRKCRYSKEGKSGVEFEVLIPRNDKVYWIYFSSTTGAEDTKLDKMLSSFRLL